MASREEVLAEIKQMVEEGRELEVARILRGHGCSYKLISEVTKIHPATIYRWLHPETDRKRNTARPAVARNVKFGTVDHAAQLARPVRNRMVGIYGLMPPVVYCIQRGEGGPVKIGWAQRLAQRVVFLRRDSPEPIIIRAAVPGGRALEAWFHRRHEGRHFHGEWFNDPEVVVADVRRFGDLHAAAFEKYGSMEAGTEYAVLVMCPDTNDLWKLWVNGATYKQIQELTGMTPGQTKVKIASMRSMGFRLPHRHVFASRSRRFDTDIPGSGNFRLLG